MSLETNMGKEIFRIYNTQCSCQLCVRGTPEVLKMSPTWVSIMKVVLFCLHHLHPEKVFFSLKGDIYNFIFNHWDFLSMSKKHLTNWRKQIQDMLSHSKNVFRSGSPYLMKNGYWGLYYYSDDPWLPVRLIYREFQYPPLKGKPPTNTAPVTDNNSSDISLKYMKIDNILNH